MAPPRVLLIYANPAVTSTPVPPYGMERVARSFKLAGCDARMESPFIEADPLATMRALLEWAPDLVGFSVRNIDDALVVRSELGPGDIDTRFYLDEVKPLVEAALAAVGPDRVLLGGAALSSGPLPVLRYLGATRAIRGAADDLCYWIGRSLARGEGPVLPEDPRVILAETPSSQPHLTEPRPRNFAAAFRAPPGPTPRSAGWLALVGARGGRVPVSISNGCDRRCDFCVEARFSGYAVAPRSHDDILAEIEALRGAGVQKFWLAASEINVPTAAHGTALLKKLKGLDLDFQVFIQVAPVDDALLDAFEGAGFDPTALSFEFGHFDDGLLRKGAGPANRRAIDKLVEVWLKRGYGMQGGSVLLGCHPDETWQTLDGALRAALEIDAALPVGLGLSYATGGRVYPETALADWVAAHRDEARPFLYGADDPSFVRPVIFSKPDSPRRLLAYVKSALAGARGLMGAMNTEAPATATRLEAEALVNRGVWRKHEGAAQAGRDCFDAALALEPEHMEALAQLALVCANDLGDPDGAGDALSRLLRGLKPDDPRYDEVMGALERLPKAPRS